MYMQQAKAGTRIDDSLNRTKKPDGTVPPGDSQFSPLFNVAASSGKAPRCDPPL